MIKEMIREFPLTLEFKINSLLHSAFPKETKAFHLYKRCQFEGAWDRSFGDFLGVLESYYNQPFTQRNKALLDQDLNRPLSHNIYNEFDLTFRTAEVSASFTAELISWSHHLLRVHFKKPLEIFSQEILGKALHRLINPLFTDKEKNLQFSDFCDRWEEALIKQLGTRLSQEFKKVRNELEWYYTENKLELSQPLKAKKVTTIYLTQTEINWVESVQKAVLENTPVPGYPLSKGTEKLRLQELDRTISLYRIIETSTSEDFKIHKNNIRTTILDRCLRLLDDCAR